MIWIVPGGSGKTRDSTSRKTRRLGKIRAFLGSGVRAHGLVRWRSAPLASHEFICPASRGSVQSWVHMVRLQAP